jgi:uncharacterized protein YndB with AHSA1/START domain
MERQAAKSGRIDSASLEVEAQPQAVYTAFTDADVLMKWLPPSGMTGRVLEYDFREGGRYRIELTYSEAPSSGVAKTSDTTDVSSGRFLKLEPGKQLVQSVEFDSPDPAFAGEMTMTWSFEPTTNGTKVTVTAQNVPSGIRKADHDEGLRASLENLARHLR